MTKTQYRYAQGWVGWAGYLLGFFGYPAFMFFMLAVSDDKQSTKEFLMSINKVVSFFFLVIMFTRNKIEDKFGENNFESFGKKVIAILIYIDSFIEAVALGIFFPLCLFFLFLI